jgi:hypothetical protein
VCVIHVTFKSLSNIFFSKIRLRARRRTWLVILANVWAGISPAVTLRRRPGLFLSLRLTNNVRIFDLYAGVVPLQSLHTVSSTVRARCNMRSDAGEAVK